jgi:hypothetical protein
VFPDAFDLPRPVYEGALAVLLVVQELSDVDSAVFELLLSMFLYHSVFEASYHLGAVLESVAPVASQRGLLELTLVVVAIPVLRHSFSFH